MKDLFILLLKSAVITIIFFQNANALDLGGAEYKLIKDKYAETTCSKSITQTELSFCLHKMLSLSNKQLNEEYSKVKHMCADEIPSCVQELISAQRVWINFRDSSCKLESIQSYGGSAYNDYLTNCLIGYTRERIQYLKQFLLNP